MRIGSIEVKKGEKKFGFLEANETHGRFAVQLPLHVIHGSVDGPVLLVQAGVSGLEIEPAMILPSLVEEIDPKAMSGTLIVVPLLNTSGFEFEQVNAVWDDTDLNAVGRGKASGTISEQLIHKYFEEVILRADALVDIHTGSLWGYFRYAGVYETSALGASRDLASAIGLPQVLLGQPNDSSMALEAAKDGKSVVSAWIGGGPGLRDYRQADMDRVTRVVLNALRHLEMVAGDLEFEGDSVMVIERHTVLRVQGERGLTFMDKEKRGKIVRAGEKVGYVMHPFTGEILQEICAPREGMVVHGGAAWPIAPEGAILGIIGDVVQEIEV